MRSSRAAGGTPGVILSALGWLSYIVAGLLGILAASFMLHRGHGGASAAGDETGHTMAFALGSTWLLPGAIAFALLGWLSRTHPLREARPESSLVDVRAMFGLLGMSASARNGLALGMAAIGVLLASGAILWGWRTGSSTGPDPARSARSAFTFLWMYMSPVLLLAATLVVLAFRVRSGARTTRESGPVDREA